MDVPELRDHSDSSDEDYVPNIKDNDNGSEDSGGDTEDDISGLGVEKPVKRSKHSTKSRKKQKNTAIDDAASSNDESRTRSEEEKKKTEDDVWADFMRDTGFQCRRNSSSKLTVDKSNSNSLKLNDESQSKIEEKSNQKIKVIQVFKFAGENVQVEKEIPKNSLDVNSLTTTQKVGKNVKSKSNLSGILNQLGKKTKINTLEKSKLDWDQFKKEQNIEEELQSHNKGKDGYLEKQDFLQRADLRRFEIEKEIRTIERNKRLHNL